MISILRTLRLAGCVACCLAGMASLAGCSWLPGLDDPLVTIAPEYTLFRMKGKTRMESGTPPRRNAPLSISDLRADDREDNVGVRASMGDGVSGLDFLYNRFESHSSRLGVARNDWGAITSPNGTPPTAESVDTRVTMDEFRLRYIAAMDLYRDEEEEDRWLQVGVGVHLAHRELSLDVRGITSSTGQKIEIKDDLSPMVAARIAGRRGPWGLTIDLAYNHDWSFGTGDFEGEFYDAAIRLSYLIEDQDLTIFGGYRRFDIPARGHEGIFEYATDFTVDGYVFGFEFTF